MATRGSYVHNSMVEGQVPTRTTPHQDHYKSVKPFIRTNTCTAEELSRWGVSPYIYDCEGHLTIK